MNRREFLHVLPKVLASRMAELPWTVDRFFPSPGLVSADTPFCHIEPVERTDVLPYANAKKSHSHDTSSLDDARSLSGKGVSKP